MKTEWGALLMCPILRFSFNAKSLNFYCKEHAHVHELQGHQQVDSIILDSIPVVSIIPAGVSAFL